MYIWIMPIIESESRAQRPADGKGVRRSLVSGVNAHLRIPRDPADFRVVVTFHHADGALCEAELTPDEAAGLMAEIGRVINRGSTNDLQSPNGERSIRRV